MSAATALAAASAATPDGDRVTTPLQQNQPHNDHLQQIDEVDPLTTYLIESSFGKLFFSVFHTTDAATAAASIDATATLSAVASTATATAAQSPPPPPPPVAKETTPTVTATPLSGALASSVETPSVVEPPSVTNQIAEAPNISEPLLRSSSGIDSFDDLYEQVRNLEFWQHLQAGTSIKKGRRGRRRKRDAADGNEDASAASLTSAGHPSDISGNVTTAQHSPIILSSQVYSGEQPSLPAPRKRGRPRKYPQNSDSRTIRLIREAESHQEIAKTHNGDQRQSPHFRNGSLSAEEQQQQFIEQHKQQQHDRLQMQYNYEQEQQRRQRLGLPRRRGRPPKISSSFDHAALSASRLANHRNLAMLHDSPAQNGPQLLPNSRSHSFGSSDSSRGATKSLIQLRKLKMRSWMEDSFVFKPWPRRLQLTSLQLHVRAIDLDRLWRAHYLHSRNDPLASSMVKRNSGARFLGRNLRRVTELPDVSL